jgi:hypothetical protein
MERSPLVLLWEDSNVNGNLIGMLMGLGMIWFAASAAGQEKQEPQTPRHLPGGGVADPAGKTGFVPNPSGGIDALDLATGKLLWSSKDANRPLFATADRLFAQKQASLIVLDTTQEGKAVREAKSIALPNWASVEPGYGQSYRGSVRLNGDTLLLSWEARAFYAGGAAPTPEIEKRARKAASGVARLDLKTGKLDSLDADQVAAGKFFPMPADAINSKAGALTLSVKDGSAKNPKNIFEKRRTLQAINEAKEVVWARDIAAPIFLPPRP